MKMPRHLLPTELARTLKTQSRRSAPAGFTLAEMLIVIVIISILAALSLWGVMAAMRKAKIAAVVMEVVQLETALENYKSKFGEYPPDFAGLAGTTTSRDFERARVMRHLAKAFPRYAPGISTGTPTNNWTGFYNDVLNGWRINVNNLRPATALAFWLGGEPIWREDTAGAATLDNGTTKIVPETPVTGFGGFAADPTNPFQTTAACASRIQPLYEFNLNCLFFYYSSTYKCTSSETGAIPSIDFREIAIWPTRVYNVTNTNNVSPIVYLRAENGNYTMEGTATSSPKSFVATAPSGAVTLERRVYPAIDTRLTTTTATAWINPKSFQIFSSGLDATYGAIATVSPTPQQPIGTVAIGTVLQFPSGDNYVDETYDDITNFSNRGTLEDAQP